MADTYALQFSRGGDWQMYHTLSDAPKDLTAAHELRQQLETEDSDWKYRIVEIDAHGGTPRVVWPAAEDEGVNDGSNI